MTSRRDRIRRCGIACIAVGSVVLLGLSGCGLPRPAASDVQPYERPALRQGEASRFIQTYSEKLSQALKDDESILDTIQAGPLLDRARAEVLVAKKEKTALNAAEFDSVTAGGPQFSDYPMWFVGFGHAADEEAGTQALLVTRTSAAEDWTAVQGLFIPNDDVPVLVTGEDSGVPQADGEFGSTQHTVSDAVASYLSDGKDAPLADASIDVKGKAFSDFRDYVDGYSKGDNAFDTVTSECTVYDQLNLASMALQTQTGSVAFGEIRCSISLEVPSEFAVTLPKAVEAVTTGDTDGNRVIIDTSIPYMVKEDSGAVSVVNSDWFLIEARTEKS